jgi:hypothetical protein
MTKVRLKYAIPEIGGALYEVTVNRCRLEDETDTKPHHDFQPYDGKASEAQAAHRQRFKEAVAYAKAAIADPDTRATYKRRAANENRLPYQLALSDYMHGKDLHFR